MRAVPATPEQIPLLCRYLYEKTDTIFEPGMCQGFAIVSDTGDFIAAVLVSNVRFHNGIAVDCEISCATETSVAWRPEVCRAVFGYVFGQLGVNRCTSITKKNNTKCRNFLEALNFKLEGCVRKGYDGHKDALIYGLLVEECQYFGDLNGQKLAESADAA